MLISSHRLCFTGESASSERCPGDPPPVHQPCEMACPGDCVLGRWGSWSPCSQSCSNKHFEGKQTRSRPVLALSRERKFTHVKHLVCRCAEADTLVLIQSNSVLASQHYVWCFKMH